MVVSICLLYRQLSAIPSLYVATLIYMRDVMLPCVVCAKQLGCLRRGGRAAQA